MARRFGPDSRYPSRRSAPRASGNVLPEAVHPLRPWRRPASGCPPCYQTQRNGTWEYRGGAIWMPGAVRRSGPPHSWHHKFRQLHKHPRGDVPLHVYPGPGLHGQHCGTGMLLRYARRFSLSLVADAKDAADVSFKALRGQIIYGKQTIENSRCDFADTTGDGLPFYSQLMTLLQVFQRKVNRDGPTPGSYTGLETKCHVWTGSKTKYGYGRLMCEQEAPRGAPGGLGAVSWQEPDRIRATQMRQSRLRERGTPIRGKSGPEYGRCCE